jgi:hypothetical protein
VIKWSWSSIGIEARNTPQFDFVLFFIFRYFIIVDSINCFFPLCYLESNVELMEMALNNVHYECYMLLWHGEWWGIDWWQDFVIVNMGIIFRDIIARLAGCLKFGLSKLV